LNVKKISANPSETEVKIINTIDPTKVLNLSGHSNSIKSISFSPGNTTVTTSSVDGQIYIWAFLPQSGPKLLHKIADTIPPTEIDSYISCRVSWHPAGNYIAAATASRNIAVLSRDTWKPQVSFVSGHFGEITDIAWSPNGAYMASSGMDDKVIIWESKKQTIIAR
jgi:chromosome transmission fidelity protein 4